MKPRKLANAALHVVTSNARLNPMKSFTIEGYGVQRFLLFGQFWRIMMKSVLLAVCLCFVAAEAQAISRYDPTRMSCDEVRAVISRDGAAILRYRSTRTPGISLYDRYVRNNRFCERGEVRKRAFVPSADLNSCPVFKCVRPEFDRRFRLLFPD